MLLLTPLQYVLGTASGALVGFTLGLVGGGGSVLAVPLLVYLVALGDPHVAIGTSALGVAANAAIGLLHHARAGNVKWRCGAMFASAGVAGAIVGSTAGKSVDGQKLLLLFALIMVIVSIHMLRGRNNPGEPGAECTLEKAPQVLGTGLATGLFSGFFGIGGGFLVVPGLVGSTGMPLLNAVGTSLVAVTAFGVTTALNYALSGLVNWSLALAFIVGGAAGSIVGAMTIKKLANRRGAISILLAVTIFSVAAYMIARAFVA